MIEPVRNGIMPTIEQSGSVLKRRRIVRVNARQASRRRVTADPNVTSANVHVGGLSHWHCCQTLSPQIGDVVHSASPVPERVLGMSVTSPPP